MFIRVTIHFKRMFIFNIVQFCFFVFRSLSHNIYRTYILLYLFYKKNDNGTSTSIYNHLHTRLKGMAKLLLGREIK